MSTEIFVENKVIRLVFPENLTLDELFFTINRCSDIDKEKNVSHHRLYDVRQSGQFSFKYEALPDISQMMELAKGKGFNHKAAFLVSTDQQMEFILAHQAFMIETDLRMAIFFKENVALEWLNCPF